MGLAQRTRHQACHSGVFVLLCPLLCSPRFINQLRPILHLDGCLCLLGHYLEAQVLRKSRMVALCCPYPRGVSVPRTPAMLLAGCWGRGCSMFVSSQIGHIEANAPGIRCMTAGLLRYGARWCAHEGGGLRAYRGPLRQPERGGLRNLNGLWPFVLKCSSLAKGERSCKFCEFLQLACYLWL